MPEVEIRALLFHRWRKLKWLVCYTEPHSGSSRRGYAQTFETALQLAKSWSLAYWSKHYGIAEFFDETAQARCRARTVDKDSSTIA